MKAFPSSDGYQNPYTFGADLGPIESLTFVPTWTNAQNRAARRAVDTIVFAGLTLALLIDVAALFR